MGGLPWRGALSLVAFYLIGIYTTVGLGLAFIWNGFRPAFVIGVARMNPDWVLPEALPRTYEVFVGGLVVICVIVTVIARAVAIEPERRRAIQDYGTFAAGTPLVYALIVQAIQAHLAA